MSQLFVDTGKSVCFVFSVFSSHKQKLCEKKGGLSISVSPAVGTLLPWSQQRKEV